MDAYEKNNEILNDFIQDVEELEVESSNDKDQDTDNKNVLLPKNQQNQTEKEKDVPKFYKNEEEKITQLKLLKLRNELLTNQIKEKEKVLSDIKKMCQKQSKKIEELKKQITENILQQNKENNSKLIYEQKKEKQKEPIKNNFNKNQKNASIDDIKTITYDIDNTNFYQCGICMDSFSDNEKIKILHCEHIFHIDCMSQWLQSNKKCPFCDQNIFY